jgi:chorismate mutase
MPCQADGAADEVGVREARPPLRMRGFRTPGRKRWTSKGRMDIAGWRKKIDEIDRRLVELLSERAQAAVEIGRLKRNTNLPIYEPQRERIVFENVQEMNRGPLPGRDLVRIFERIMDVMRNIQKDGIGANAERAKAGETELDSDVND